MHAKKDDGSGYNDRQKAYALITSIKVSYAGHYQVAFNGNGSTKGSMSNQVLTYGAGNSLNLNQFERAGYKFTGWNDQIDANGNGIGNSFADGATITEDFTKTPSTSSANGIVAKTLYAQWTPLFGLVYHQNASSGDTTTVYYNIEGGNPITLYTADDFAATGALSGFAKSGYYFAGWADSANSEVSIGSVIPKEQVKNGQTRDIYAIWKPIEYTIYFDKNNTSASGTVNNIGGYGGSAIASLPYGYHMQDGFFTGWTWNATGSGTFYKKGEGISATALNALLTNAQNKKIDTASVSLRLYAQWVTNIEFGKDAGHLDEKWGSQSNPYVIRNVTQLNNLAKIVNAKCSASASGVVGSIVGSSYAYATNPLASANGGYANCYFRLDVDITNMSGFTTPIGTNTAVFSGFFDGNNKTLSGININKAGSYVGLFGYTSGATIQNLTISGAVKGSKYVGGVVGYALNTTIYNVTNNATVTARYSVDKDLSTSIRQYDGGNQTNEGFDKVFDGKTSTKFCGTQSGMSFVADLRSRLAISGFAITNANDTESNSNRRPKKIQIWGSNTENNWPSDSPNDEGNAGAWPALYNYKNWNLVFSLDTDNFSSTNHERVEFAFDGNKTYKYRYYWVYIISAGGIIQFSEFDFLAAGEDVGGVVGYASGTSGNGTVISNVKNNASVTGSNYTGGLVGRASGNFAIIDSSNAGGIMGFDGVAGVLGAMTNNANVTITSCHNSGTVSSSPESNGVAGIVGHTESASNRLVVQGCKNNAAITGDRNVGGIGGRIETTRNAKGSLVFANCYNDGSIAATAYGTVGGIAGYFFSNGTSIADVATISYCFSSGAVSSNSTASDKNIGGIVGNPRASTLTSTRVYNCYTTNTTYAISGTANATIDNTNYVIASGASAPSTTNGGKYLVYNSAFTFKPAIISGSTYTSYNSWTVIAEYFNATVNGEVVRVFNDINGFMVSGDVAPSSSQYFLSRKGVSSSEYLTPSKVENGNPTNAADRSNSDTFTVTAWYGANTNSDIYCSREQIKIDNST
ncbi:MAG TPA: hypothetical protein DEF02_02810, partial [Clostridiales bacterium]|nr:hypothetical protein [Clostridiales bacterium]